MQSDTNYRPAHVGTRRRRPEIRGATQLAEVKHVGERKRANIIATNIIYCRRNKLVLATEKHSRASRRQSQSRAVNTLSQSLCSRRY